MRKINFAGKEQAISYIETSHVTKGVICDIYKFVDDNSKDLGIIRIDTGGKTPLQEVLKGDRTIEGYISGRGKLVIIKEDNTQKEYSVNENMQRPFEMVVEIGEKMQWQADSDSFLIVYEICFPPYEDGRFKNL